MHHVSENLEDLSEVIISLLMKYRRSMSAYLVWAPLHPCLADVVMDVGYLHMLAALWRGQDKSLESFNKPNYLIS